MRGTPVIPGEFPFEIQPNAGIVMLKRNDNGDSHVASQSMFEFFQLPDK
jgi:hypothetical protein